MKMKKLLAGFLAGMMLVCSTSEVFAENSSATRGNASLEGTGKSGESEEILSGACGKNLTWELVGGTLTISGSGDMQDYKYWEILDQIHNVVIEDGVTSIGDYAFEDCIGLTSIEISDSVIRIGEGAFENCSNLTSIEIPSSVTTIGEGAFKNCSGLTSIVIPSNVTSIENYAFENCSSLTSVAVDTDNNTYDSRDNCNAVIEKASNTLIAGCKNTIVPSDVISIGIGAFSGCIGLTSVEIPSSVTSIGWDSFRNCSGLESIVVDSENKIYDSRDNCDAIIERASNTLIVGCKNTTIPTDVTSIGDFAFENCIGLTSIEIPGSVTSIGRASFRGCSGLASIVVDSENKIYDSRDNCNAIIETEFSILIVGCKNTIIPTDVRRIENYAFYGCSDLTSIEIPNSVISIGDFAFYRCSGLASTEILSSAVRIGYYAFYDCSELSTLSFLGNAPEIDGYAFCGVTATAFYPSGNDTWTEAVMQNYGGNITWVPKTFLSAEEMTLSSTTYTYDGEEKKPSVTVKDAAGNVISSDNYTVKYSDNINAGTATVTVIMKKDYTGTLTETFTINPAAAARFVLSENTYTYDGTMKVPEVTVYDSEDNVIPIDSYVIVYSNIVNAGTAKVTVVLQGNYCGTLIETFTIDPAEAAELVLSEETYTYNGKEKKPSVTVKDSAGNVISSDNYTVTYSNNTNVGTATVKVDMKGNYIGTLTRDFTIKKASQTLTAKIAASSLIYGKTSKITASGKGKITYSSSNTSVATVSSSGVVTAKGAGTATITVKAAGDSNYNSATKTIKVTVQYATPSISSVSNTSGGVQIKWAKVSGAAKYRVYRKTTGGWSKVGETTGTSYTDTSAKSGTTYSYTVRCISSDGKTTTSNYHTTGKSIVRLSQPAPTLSNTGSGVKISWSKVTGATGYYVYRKSGNGSWKKIKTTSSTSYTDTAAKNGTTYYYTVKAYKGSSASSFVTTKKIVRLSTSSISSATNSAGKKMTVKWAKNASATGYEIKYVTGSTTKTVTVSGASTVSKVISGLTKGKTYKVYVRSYKTVSGTKYYSEWSSTKSVKISK